MLLQLRRTSIFVLMTYVAFASGCTALMTDVQSESPKQKVICDASWHSQNCSPEIIDQIKRDRRSHIQQTLQERKAGRVSVPIQLDSLGQSPTATDIP